MPIKQIRKRDGSIKEFEFEKIVSAIFKAMEATNLGSKEDAVQIAKSVSDRVDEFSKEMTEKGVIIEGCDGYCPTVEEIQDYVEAELMKSNFHDVAKSYIIYREKRAQERKRDLFKKRINIKPNEYPELLEYVDAIRHSYWIHTEFNYTSDIQDFKVNVNDVERNAIKNAMLAIAQIEVNVKTFWADVYKKMPKPEIAAVGVTFAESEVRHQDAYSHLLEILGLSTEFEKIREIPVMMDRINYLEKSMATSQSADNREYMRAVLLFSLFIEQVSLFSQFLIMMAFNKHKNLFKGISNAVEATSKEEQIHGLFGIDLINLIKSEHPEWFDEKQKEDIVDACKNAYEAESKIIDWIFEKGEIDFLPKNVVNEFIKNRLNNSLVSIGLTRIFEVDEKLLDETEWFDDEIIGTKHGDFFVKRSINYNKKNVSITGDDLF
jgi:ribonucleoside-diphosphate reductase beta chain